MRRVLPFVLALGCGGGAQKAQDPSESAKKDPDVTAQHGNKGGPSVSQELGQIDPKLVESAFRRVQSQLVACHHTGMSRLDYLEGDVKFFVRVGTDGRARFAYIEDSNLGDRETEECLLGALRAMAFPVPVGGDAEVRKGLGFDAGDARPPTEWSSEKARGLLESRSAEIRKCTDGVRGPFKVTAHVEPDGKDGKIVALGMAVGNREASERIPCLTTALRGGPMPSPGSYAAKISFTIP